MDILKEKKEIKVATVAYYFYPRNNAESLVATRLLNIESDIKYVIYTSMHNAENIEEIKLVKNIEIIQINNSIGLTFLNWKIFNNKYTWVIKVFNIIKDKKFDIIYTRSTPVFDHFIGFLLRIKTGKPWVVHFSDPWFDSPYRKKILVWDYFLEYLENTLLRKSDIIIVTNENFSAFLKKKHPKLAYKINVLLHSKNDALFPYVRPKNKKITLSHVGSFYGKRLPDSFLKLLDKISTKDIQLNFVGNNKTDEVFNTSNNYISFKEIKFYGQVSYNESLQFSIHSDYLLLIDANFPETNMFLPSKLMDYLVVKKPIITMTNKESPVHKILKEQENFLLFYEDSKEINIQKLQNIIMKRLIWEEHYFEKICTLFDSKNLNIELGNLFKSIQH